MATTSFFEPVSVGALHFVDGALHLNNPVIEVEREASDIWCSNPDDLKFLLNCFISIGTGYFDSALENNEFLSKALVAISIEAEATELKFRARQNFDPNQYFRFNVGQQLKEVGLADYKNRGIIEAETRGYLLEAAQYSQVRHCVKNLMQKYSMYIKTFLVQGIIQHRYPLIRLYAQTKLAGRFRSEGMHNSSADLLSFRQ